VPDNYRNYNNGKDLPETIPGWIVHDEIEGKVGLVSDPFGFEDSPDCEYISSGINMKAMNSVALGRQGNWFLWGFHGPPATLTDEARRVFLNTVVYMRQFDGQAAYGTAEKQGRDWVLSYCDWLAEGDARGYYAGRFDPALLAETDSSGTLLAEIFAENMEYVRLDDDRRWTIDEDARELGISNRSPELIETCIDLLDGDGAESARARRLLDRYTEEDVSGASEWQAWYRENRQRLYFTDTGGYLFKVRP
ncbi:hypothetical protein ACFL6R_07445, partial [Gemmatimonadota bacterium]